MSLLPTINRQRGVTRWDPFQEIRELQNELSRAFRSPGNGWEFSSDLWTPLMDIQENDKTITLKVEVPGIDKKDIKVEVENGILTVSGERKFEKEEKKEDFTRVERSYGSFSRSLSLPDYVDAEKIDAQTKDGVLRVVLQKTANAKSQPKKIEVK